MALLMAASTICCVAPPGLFLFPYLTQALRPGLGAQKPLFRPFGAAIWKTLNLTCCWIDHKILRLYELRAIYEMGSSIWSVSIPQPTETLSNPEIIGMIFVHDGQRSYR